QVNAPMNVADCIDGQPFRGWRELIEGRRLQLQGRSSRAMQDIAYSPGAQIAKPMLPGRASSDRQSLSRGKGGINQTSRQPPRQRLALGSEARHQTYHPRSARHPDLARIAGSECN